MSKPSSENSELIPYLSKKSNKEKFLKEVIADKVSSYLTLGVSRTDRDIKESLEHQITECILELGSLSQQSSKSEYVRYTLSDILLPCMQEYAFNLAEPYKLPNSSDSEDSESDGNLPSSEESEDRPVESTNSSYSSFSAQSNSRGSSNISSSSSNAYSRESSYEDISSNSNNDSFSISTTPSYTESYSISSISYSSEIENDD